MRCIVLFTRRNRVQAKCVAGTPCIATPCPGPRHAPLLLGTWWCVCIACGEPVKYAYRIARCSFKTHDLRCSSRILCTLHGARSATYAYVRQQNANGVVHRSKKIDGNPEWAPTVISTRQFLQTAQGGGRCRRTCCVGESQARRDAVGVEEVCGPLRPCVCRIARPAFKENGSEPYTGCGRSLRHWRGVVPVRRLNTVVKCDCVWNPTSRAISSMDLDGSAISCLASCRRHKSR